MCSLVCYRIDLLTVNVELVIGEDWLEVWGVPLTLGREVVGSGPQVHLTLHQAHLVAIVVSAPVQYIKNLSENIMMLILFLFFVKRSFSSQ